MFRPYFDLRGFRFVVVGAGGGDISSHGFGKFDITLLPVLNNCNATLSAALGKKYLAHFSTEPITKCYRLFSIALARYSAD